MKYFMMLTMVVMAMACSDSTGDGGPVQVFSDDVELDTVEDVDDNLAPYPCKGPDEPSWDGCEEGLDGNGRCDEWNNIIWCEKPSDPHTYCMNCFKWYPTNMTCTCGKENL